VEGPILATGHNQCHHAVEIIEDVSRCNPQGCEACFGQLTVASKVALRRAPHRVGLTIHFDRDPAREAGEVCHVAAAWKLSTKPQAVRLLTQLLPQNDLRQGHTAAKLTCTADGNVRRADCAVPDAPPFDPSTMLRMVPLPVPGRI
jgi:hypothetical protein